MQFIPDSTTVTLADGKKIRLKEVTPEDRDRAIEAFDQLSINSVYYRFWNDLIELDESTLSRLTNTDRINHIAWCAIDPDKPDHPGLGAASLWRSPEDPSIAEVSFTVLDAHQGRGLGTILLAVLWVIAENIGIDIFHANVLANNSRAIHWLVDLGGRIVREKGVCEIDLLLDLDENVGRERRNDLKHWILFFRKEFS